MHRKTAQRASPGHVWVFPDHPPYVILALRLKSDLGRKSLKTAGNSKARRRAKIVCTLGPASHSKEMIHRLILAGMDVARVNFSHGTFAEHTETIRRVRAASKEFQKPIAILQDLPGPKVRTRRIRGGAVELTRGREIVLTPRPILGTAERISTTHPLLAKDVRPGNPILIDDGLIHLTVKKVVGGDVRCRIDQGGILRDHKGINLPASAVNVPTLTRKDREALEFGIRHKVDYIALSFVREAADLETARRILARRKSKIPLIAKLEKPQAISHLEAILEAADGVMVARGDLGVEMPPEKVPIVQKQIIRAANARALPVITATQMLFSMISNPRPTRAEASDVANAILDGTDAVMLSGETAIGRYPVRAVEMISRIIMEAEAAARKRDVAPEGAVTPASVVTRAACDAVQALKARAIVAFTQSGLTARFVARNRPAVPILAYTHDERILKRMALYWGVTPQLLPLGDHTEKVFEQVEERLLRHKQAKEGDVIAILSGSPLSERGPTNLLKLQTLRRRSRR